MIRAIADRFRQLLSPQSLRYQLLSRSLLIMSALLLLIGAFQYVLMQKFLYSNRAASIQTQIRSLPPQIWQLIDEWKGRADPHNPLFSLRIPESTLAFVDPQGEFHVLFEETSQNAVPKLSDAAYAEALHGERNRPPNYTIAKAPNGSKQLVVLQPVMGRDPVTGRGQFIGVVQVGINAAPLQDLLVRQLIIFLGLSIFALLMALMAFLPILRRTLIPLSNMIKTAERINAGNLDERVPLHQGQIEMDKLAASFNDMLERLEVSFASEKEAKEQMRRFIADASHELRTPLTSIHGFLEVLMRGAASNPAQLHRSLTSMYGESERLNKLVQDLLMLAKLDQAPTFELTEGRLDSVLRTMEAQLRLLAGDRQVEVAASEEVWAAFDQDRIKQVILNLFQNAVQHTDPHSGRIRISLESSGEGVELAIQDNGPGIPPEHLPHLFERFYRVDTARSRKQGGAGLGLAITKTLVEAHGGRITCESKPGAGAIFRVWLPKATE